MNLKKIIRDALILILFCASFYGMIRAVDLFGGESEEVSAEEYSEYRIKADAAFRSDNWETAIVNLKKQLEQDPYDGHAWFRLGTSHYELCHFFRRQASVAAQREPGAERIAEYERLAAEQAELGMPPLRRATDFARFRNLARQQLAGLLAMYGQEQESLKLLEAGLNERFIYGRGMRRNYDLIALHDMPEFQRLLNLESEISRGYLRNSNATRTIGGGGFRGNPPENSSAESGRDQNDRSDEVEYGDESNDESNGDENNEDEAELEDSDDEDSDGEDSDDEDSDDEDSDDEDSDDEDSDGDDSDDENSNDENSDDEDSDDENSGR